MDIDQADMDIVIPAGGNWSGRIPRGATLRLIDLEGCQAVDFLCYNAADPSERYNACDTMKIAGSIYIGTGSLLYSDMGRPLFTVTEDTCGRHDTIGGCCSRESNFVRYGVAEGPNCRDNFLTALGRYGLGKKDIVTNLNFFMSVPVLPDGSMAIVDGHSKPNDHIDLRAEMDVLVALSNCPQINNPANGYNPTPIRLIVTHATKDQAADAPPSEMFDPAHYVGTRRPLLEAETLPPWCYTSPLFYQREVERIWRKVWNFVGHVSQVDNPGDYFALNFAGIPTIILRDGAGQLRAFANSCRHRGSELLEGAGNCRTIVCPYHSWAFGLDGSLLAAPEMKQTIGFDPADNGLTLLRIDTWGGFLFLCFDDTAPDLAHYLGDLPQRVAPYGLADMACVRRKEFMIECNWKLFVENAKESYHIATVHRNTINKYASARSSGYWVEDVEGAFVCTFAQHEGSMALLKGASGFPPIETLAGLREAGGTRAPLIYPSTYLACTIDCAWYLELHPLGPTRTKLIHGALFPRDRIDRPDFEEKAANYFHRWDLTIEEDIVASDRQQRGMAGPFVRPGRFSHREPLVHRIDNWVLDQVLD